MKKLAYRSRNRNGMTLVEIMVATAIMLLVVAGTLSTFLFIKNILNTSMIQLRTSSRMNRAVNYLVYGTASFGGLREAVSGNATLTTSSNGWTFTYSTNQTVSYLYSSRRITDGSGFVLGTNITSSSLTMTNGALLLSLTVIETNGKYMSTNISDAFVKMRNK